MKRSAGDELVRAIRAVNQGGVYLDPAIAEKASISAPELASASDGDGGELSRREEDVLKLVAQGIGDKQIAGQLEVSVKSVETSRRGFRKEGIAQPRGYRPLRHQAGLARGCKLNVALDAGYLACPERGIPCRSLIGTQLFFRR